MGPIRLLSATLLLIGIAQPSSAQQFPSRPITLVVPYAAGGNVDVSTRILQAAIVDSLGKPVLVENRPGAGGIVAGEYVARSKPDGHTLFVGSNGPIMLGPMTMPNAPYRWETAFAPVSSLAFATNMLLVRPALPIRSVHELVEYGRANPGKLTLATSSIASINHFMGELLKLRTGISWTEVHYRGNAPAITIWLRATSISASNSWSTRSSTSKPAGCGRLPCLDQSAPPCCPMCRPAARPDIRTCRV
jgi:tripartite-type tricarboxylate transporter receptor subunit TctC